LKALLLTMSLVIAPLSASAAAVDGCADGTGWICDSRTSPSKVEIGAQRSIDYKRAPGDRENTTDREVIRDANPVPAPTEEPERIYPGGLTADEWFGRCPYDSLCRGVIPPVEEDEPTDPEAPDVTTATIQDVAVYAPDPPNLTGEPGGMGVVGMPTNFVVDAAPHTVDGEIFDIPVTVRFTPVSYLFHYGDSTTRETTTPGTDWADLGAPQFTATPTSHSYTAVGTYDAHVDIRYAAEGDAGFGWFPIAGILDVSTDAVPIRIVDVETALVEQTCAEDPDGPGC